MPMPPSPTPSPYPRLGRDSIPGTWRTIDRALAVGLLLSFAVPTLLPLGLAQVLVVVFPMPFLWWFGRRSGIVFMLLAAPHFVFTVMFNNRLNGSAAYPFQNLLVNNYMVFFGYFAIRTLALWIERSDRELATLDDDEKLSAD